MQKQQISLQSCLMSPHEIASCNKRSRDKFNLLSGLLLSLYGIIIKVFICIIKLSVMLVGQKNKSTIVHAPEIYKYPKTLGKVGLIIIILVDSACRTLIMDKLAEK
ncbi:hypothetical protein TorRG33x02_038910 [Trema orientale]|uniref:Transmembrane protein n=1 Tax=Trema orientale TaxID=63057 RepID=A0A2P5FQN7_TREOI|nr:hypothetical protein TorRG33x02_038910 [Trema orientale]